MKRSGWWLVAALVVGGLTADGAPPARGTRNARTPAAGRTGRAAAGRPKLPPLTLPGHQEREARRKQWSRDLAHWRRVLSGSPDATARQQALYHQAVGLIETDKPGEAVGVLERLVAESPQGAWTGAAHVQLFDLKLTHELDPAAARGHAEAGRAWAALPPHAGGDTPASPAGTDGPVLLAAWSSAVVVREADRRLMLLDWLGDRAEGRRPASRSDQPVVAPAGLEPVLRRVEALSAASHAPPRPAEGTDELTLLLNLADLAVASAQFDLARAVADRLLKSRRHERSPRQTSRAQFLRGRGAYGALDQPNPAQARADYLASHRTDPQAPWAGEALFLAGNIVWNVDRDAQGAVALWRRVVAEHADAENAPRAAYFIGVVFEATEDADSARAAYEDALRRFPESPYHPLIEKHLRAVGGNRVSRR